MLWLRDTSMAGGTAITPVHFPMLYGWLPLWVCSLLLFLFGILIAISFFLFFVFSVCPGTLYLYCSYVVFNEYAYLSRCQCLRAPCFFHLLIVRLGSCLISCATNKVRATMLKSYSFPDCLCIDRRLAILNCVGVTASQDLEHTRRTDESRTNGFQGELFGHELWPMYQWHRRQSSLCY